MNRMSHLIAVLSKIPKLSIHIQRYLPQVKVFDINPDDIPSDLNEAEIVVGDCDLLAKYVQKLKNAKWVQSTWAGVDAAAPVFKENNVSFLFTRYSDNLFGRSMSEYVVAQIYNYERNQQIQYENQSKSTWDVRGKIQNHKLIQDLTIGILGMGNIGLQIAKVLKTLGAVVWGLKRTKPKENFNYIDRFLTMDELSELLRNCDYIINLLPSTEDTKGLLNGDRLKACQNKGSVFVNIGRGSIIRERDLINALEQKWISAAILDVFEEEPLPSDNKLWQIPQVTITPHIAGVSRPQDVAKYFAENYNRYKIKKQLLNVVNLNHGY